MAKGRRWPVVGELTLKVTTIEDAEMSEVDRAQLMNFLEWVGDQARAEWRRRGKRKDVRQDLVLEDPEYDY